MHVVLVSQITLVHHLGVGLNVLLIPNVVQLQLALTTSAPTLALELAEIMLNVTSTIIYLYVHVCQGTLVIHFQIVTLCLKVII